MNDEETNEKNIVINGITFTTKEAFAKYREDHTFRMGDAVNVMTNEFPETKVYPGFITGISDFGNGKVALDLVYFSGYVNDLRFAEIYSDECNAKNSIVGIAPINQFNDLRMKFTDCIARMEQEATKKNGELASLRKLIERMRQFAKTIGIQEV